MTHTQILCLRFPPLTNSLVVYFTMCCVMKFLCRVALQGIGTPQGIHLQTFAVLTEAGEHIYKNSYTNIFFSYFVLAELLNAQRHGYFFTEYNFPGKCYFPGKLFKMFVTNPHHCPMKPKIEPKLKKISHVKSFGDSLFCTLMDGLSHHLGRWPLSVDSERSTEVKVIGELRKGPPPSHAERSCQSFTQA